MKTLGFALRNFKELVRDKVNLFFGLCFPLIIFVLLSIINRSIPAEAEMDLFHPENLAPGVAVFSLSFLSLFSGTVISKDRSSAFALRLFASPLKPAGFLSGYALPLIPLAVAQFIVCFACALVFGMPFTANVFLTMAVLLPTALLFIALGLIAGSVFSDKQVGSVCGALLTNLTAWLSGTWFDLKLIGGGFEKACSLLPFYRAVRSARSALAGNYAGIMPDLWWVIGYAVLLFALAVFVFAKKAYGDEK